MRQTVDTGYYAVTVASCVAWTVFRKVISPLVSGPVSEKYRQLTRVKRMDWDSRIASSVHSLVVGVACMYALFFDEYIRDDPVLGDSHLVKYTCAVVTGYMINDCFNILENYQDNSELFYLAHHAAVIYAFWFVISYGVFPWFANFRMMAELSTPFVNARWFLDIAECKRSSNLFLINGVSMAAMFFIVRIGVLPTYWNKVYTVYMSQTPQQYADLGRTWFVLMSSCVVLDSINVYWMWRIYLGARKVLKVSLDQNRNEPVVTGGGATGDSQPQHVKAS